MEEVCLFERTSPAKKKKKKLRDDVQQPALDKLLVLKTIEDDRPVLARARSAKADAHTVYITALKAACHSYSLLRLKNAFSRSPHIISSLGYIIRL